MQRLFTMFPTAGPGAALVLLRVAVAWSLIERGAGGSAALEWLAVAIAALLVAGAATPVAAVVAGLLLAPDWSQPALAGRVWPEALTAFGLALLGPGAYSFDARSFGRRRVVTSHDAGE